MQILLTLDTLTMHLNDTKDTFDWIAQDNVHRVFSSMMVYGFVVQDDIGCGDESIIGSGSHSS